MRAGAPDAALTPSAGLVVVTELCGRLGVIEAVDAAVGPIKQRDRGYGAKKLLAGMDFVVSWTVSGPIQPGTRSRRCRA